MEKLLSISVASYNLGEMILDNLKSFCESKVADLVEVIVTDDGSKDNTPQIVEKYAKKYPNTIKLIKKKNEGPGSTVNSGIKNATGKYFRMVDGDDWVNTKNLEEFVEFLKTCNSDMVVCDYVFYDESKHEICETRTFDLTPLVEQKFDDASKNVPNEMHAIVYKTEIMQKNNIVLDNCFYTDVEYVLFPIKYVKTVSYFNKVLYNYRIGQAGQSVNINSMKKNIAMHDLVLTHLCQDYESSKNMLSGSQRKFILKRLSNMSNTQLRTLLCFDINKENKQRVKNFTKELKQKSLDVFAEFAKSKRYKLLKYSCFILYGFVAKKFQKGK